VVEVGLECTVADDGCDHVAHRLGLISEHGMGAAEGALTVALHLVAHEHFRGAAVGREVDAFSPHPLTHPVGDEGYRARHATPDVETSVACAEVFHRRSSCTLAGGAAPCN